MRSFTLTRFLVLAPIIFAGCAIGPTWHSEISLPPALGDVTGKRAIVSDFLQSVSAVSYTQSAEIQEIRESVKVQDISFRIASSLQGLGVPATARAEVEVDDLGPNDVLVRGTIIGAGYVGPSWYANVLVWGCSLLVVGGIVPTPIPYASGARIKYRVEMITSDGTIVLQSGDKEVIATYKDYYIWPTGANVYVERLMPPAADKVAEAIAQILKR